MMENKVDLNSASLDELTTLPGIGRKLASRLIQYRSTVGRFRTVEEMTAVPGITKELLDRFSDRVRTGEASEAEMELPPLRIAVTLTQPTPKGDYFGHRMAAIYTHRERVPGVDGEIVSLWVIGQSSEPLARDGTATLLLPNLADLQGDVNFQVTAPDGENLLSTVLPAAKLTDKLALTVQPKAAPTTQPTTDPAFGQPTRLRGRVIDRAGKVQIANRQVVIWGASKPNPHPADFIALIVVQTDNSRLLLRPLSAGKLHQRIGRRLDQRDTRFLYLFIWKQTFFRHPSFWWWICQTAWHRNLMNRATRRRATRIWPIWRVPTACSPANLARVSVWTSPNQTAYWRNSPIPMWYAPLNRISKV